MKKVCVRVSFDWVYLGNGPNRNEFDLGNDPNRNGSSHKLMCISNNKIVTSSKRRKKKKLRSQHFPNKL